MAPEERFVLDRDDPLDTKDGELIRVLSSSQEVVEIGGVLRL